MLAVKSGEGGNHQGSYLKAQWQMHQHTHTHTCTHTHKHAHSHLNVRLRTAHNAHWNSCSDTGRAPGCRPWLHSSLYWVSNWALCASTCREVGGGLHQQRACCNVAWCSKLQQGGGGAGAEGLQGERVAVGGAATGVVSAVYAFKAPRLRLTRTPQGGRLPATPAAAGHAQTGEQGQYARHWPCLHTRKRRATLLPRPLKGVGTSRPPTPEGASPPCKRE